MAIDVTHSFTMRKDHLAIHRRGRLRESVPYVAGTATFNKLKGTLLTTAGQSIYRKPSFPPLDRSEDRLKEIAPLAKAGWDILKGMFGSAGAATIARLIEEVPADEGIEVRQKKLWIPWSLTYLRDPAEAVALYDFMGSKRLIVDVLTSDESSAPYADARRLGNIGLVDDDQLPSWSPNGLERSELARHARGRFRPMYVPGDPTRSPLGNLDRAAELRRYGAYVADRWNALHWGAHAIVPNRDPVLYRLRVSTNFEHTMPELMEEAEQWGGVSTLPFSFFNSCHSSLAQAAGEFGPAWDFSVRGVRCVVGTSTEICDELAVEFAATFYEFAFAQGLTAGEAFLAARTKMLTQYGNPAFLVYHLHGQSDHTFGSTRATSTAGFSA